jgi:hypothetical protein
VTRPASSGSWADELYNRLLPIAYADEENGWPLLHFCSALGTMFQDVRDLVRDTDDGPGWSALFDIDRCPPFALAYLAQFRGVTLPSQLAGQSDADYDAFARDYIRRADGKRRGSPDAIVAAAQRRLTGTRFVDLIERYGGSAWQLVVVTLSEETPDHAGTLNDIVSQKPAGIVLTHVIADSLIIEELDGTIDGLSGAIDLLGTGLTALLLIGDLQNSIDNLDGTIDALIPA